MQYSLIKNETIPGTGNLPGATLPRLMRDGRLDYDSPLINAGSLPGTTQVDRDLEPRSPPGIDIGADEWLDSDGDQLSDAMERKVAGNLFVLTSRAADPDVDGLTTGDELSLGTSPVSFDSDSDGLGDGHELMLGTDPNQADSDADGMLDGDEASNGLDPLQHDAMLDADAAGYPNIFELRSGGSPSDSAVYPTPDVIVSLTTGDDSPIDHIYPSLSTALSAASSRSGPQILLLEPGVYTGPQNRTLTVWHNQDQPVLLIGRDGAAKTILDAEFHGGLISFWTDTALTSLTLMNSSSYGISTYHDGRFRIDNVLMMGHFDLNSRYALDLNQGTDIHIVSSTFFDNGTSGAEIRLCTDGEVHLDGVAVWKNASGTSVRICPGTIVHASHSIVKGTTFPGAGNLPGDLDPRITPEGRLWWDSPLRAAAQPITRFDLDLEPRIPSSPDIGVDQWTDADGDGVVDFWEMVHFSSLSTATSTTDTDSDGLLDLLERRQMTDPNRLDTDDDLLPDGFEVWLGTDPLRPDATTIRQDTNGDGVLDGLAIQLGHLQAETEDTDGDGLSNRIEINRGLDPLNPDSDGDGVQDSVDDFPHDPTLSVLLSDSATDFPAVALSRPKFATEL